LKLRGIFFLISLNLPDSDPGDQLIQIQNTDQNQNKSRYSLSFSTVSRQAVLNLINFVWSS